MTATEKYEGDADDVAMMPIAIPMIAGPGAITTVIVLVDRREDLGLGPYARGPRLDRGHVGGHAT